MVYYYYNNVTTLADFHSGYLINQGDSTITYPSGEQPGSESRAFLDYSFYGDVCGKTAASGNIRQYGCAICCIAMYLLYKSRKVNTNNNVYYAVKAATIDGTDVEADFLHGGQIIEFYNAVKRIYASITAINNADYYLQNGQACIFRMQRNDDESHYVLVYGIDNNASGTEKYWVADPDGGRLRTLTEAFYEMGVTPNMSYVTEKYLID